MKTLRLIGARIVLAVLIFVTVVVCVAIGVALGTLALLVVCYQVARAFIDRD